MKDTCFSVEGSKIAKSWKIINDKLE